MRALLDRDTVVVTYSQKSWLDSIAAECGARVLGAPAELCAALRDKQIVDDAIRGADLPRLHQHYFGLRDTEALAAHVEKVGDCVLRPSITEGRGEGVSVARTRGDVMAYAASRSPDETVSASQYFATALPLSVGGVVWPNGEITVHPTSVQLLGIDGCSNLPFGFSGNDFALAKTLSNDDLNQIEHLTRTVGAGLHKADKLGAFGLDLIKVGGDLMVFVELNARLQGSSGLASTVVERKGQPGIVLEHTAALLGCEPVEHIALVDRMANLDPVSQLLLRHDAHGPALRTPARSRLDLLPAPGVVLNTGALQGRLTSECSVSTGVEQAGYQVDPAFSPVSSPLLTRN